MRYIFIIFFLKLLLPEFLQAQIQAPDFLCVKGDSLFWDLPTNTCGPFISYEVFSSTNFNGPYVKIADLTNPSDIFYFDLNTSGEQRWYYLQSNFDCPGVAVLQSDTLDNRPPEVSPIRSVSVDGVGGEVLITWQESSSPEVFGYIIYRETNIGVVPIDTVFSGTTYLDLAAQGNSQSEKYFVNALDRCGNTSIFDKDHNTVFIEATVVPCEQGIAVTWNPYVNWPNGVQQQEIWLRELSGGMPYVAAILDGTVNSHLITGLTDGSDYEIFIQATEAVTGEVSVSNHVGFTADIVQPSDTFLLENVSVLPDNSVELTWSWNTSAEISEVQILNSAQNADYQLVETFSAPSPLLPEVQFFDNNSVPEVGRVFYQIQSIDDCGDASASTYGSTIFLLATGLTENSNQLTWTAFDIENSTVESYDIYRIQDGVKVFLTTTSIDESTYLDEFSLSDFISPTICYQIEAQGKTVGPTGLEKQIRSLSNIACVKQPLRIFVPNALVPEGFNQMFKPVIGFDGDIVEYEMQIYDRYGKRVFFTEDFDEGWRGKKDGKKLPQGVYVYQITVTELSGEVTKKKGTLLLLR